MRQGVEQCDIRVGGATGLGLIGRVELGDVTDSGRFLVLQFVVGVAEGLGERVIGIAVLCLAQNGILTAGQVLHDSLEPFTLGLSSSGGSVVDPGDIRGEQLLTECAEDAVGVELRHRVEDGVFTDVDRLGVTGVSVGASPVVSAWPALVVDVPTARGALHAP
ncbi:hypothetical protein [Nocardia acidivorans]|uniref:hypothetical protein n=1 Tax=Nocardia acidivorans TaxID=404580 RepID=UPI0008364EC6|nr:hypothetical protein [Nocardia acidivorans]